MSSSAPDTPKDAVFTISQMAREFGVTPRTLRFYEDKGLIQPNRDGQSRLYTHRERGRLKLILQGKRVGLPLDDIREILDLYTLEDGERSQMYKARERLAKQLKTLTKQREDIDRALNELNDNMVWLNEQIAKTGPPQSLDKMTAFGRVANMTLNNAENA